MAKGQVSADAALTNQYRLEIPGTPPIYFARVGEISRELVTTELADKTAQTTGQINVIETEADTYAHHVAERLALEALLTAATVGAPGHKIATALLFLLGADGQPRVTYSLAGLIVKGRKTPELNSGDDGAGVLLTWMLSIDDAIEV